MAIDWKTIISEFDGKPTLLQAVGKLRKAVEDETITIQQAQAEIAKLESQQKADEALITTAQSTADEAKINAYNASQKGDQALGKATTAQSTADEAKINAYNASQKGDQALGKATTADTKAQNAQSAAQAADTKAQQALDLARTNETNIGTLDSQVTALQNKASIEVTLTSETATRGTLTDEQLATLLLNDNCYIKHNGIIYTLFKRSDTVLQYTAGYLNDTRNVQNIKVLVNPKAWTIENIALPQTKIYKHQLTFKSGSNVYKENGYACIYSSKNTQIASLADLKTILGNTFQLPVYGQYLYLDGGDNNHYFDYCYVTESKIYVRSYYTSGGTPDEVERIITDVENVSWSHITITDTVTAI